MPSDMAQETNEYREQRRQSMETLRGMGFDGTPLSKTLAPPLTTMRQDATDLADLDPLLPASARVLVSEM